MNGQAPYVVYCIVAAVFVGSALVSRRIPMARALRMALAWMAIFAVAIAIAVAIGGF